MIRNDWFPADAQFNSKTIHFGVGNSAGAARSAGEKLKS